MLWTISRHIDIGAKMPIKEAILDYLDGKNDGDELVRLLREQRKTAPERDSSIDQKIVPLIMKLLKRSPEKIRYHAILYLANIRLWMDAKTFHSACQAAAMNITDKDGNIRQACFLLNKNINCAMVAFPLMNAIRNASEREVNLVYESFANLFWQLDYMFHNMKDQNARSTILRSLETMLPKFQDMAEFWNDREEIEMVNRLKEQIAKRKDHAD